MKKYYEIAVDKFQLDLITTDRDMGTYMLTVFLSNHCILSLARKRVKLEEISSGLYGKPSFIKWS